MESGQRNAQRNAKRNAKRNARRRVRRNERRAAQRNAQGDTQTGVATQTGLTPEDLHNITRFDALPNEILATIAGMNQIPDPNIIFDVMLEENITEDIVVYLIMYDTNNPAFIMKIYAGMIELDDYLNTKKMSPKCHSHDGMDFIRIGDTMIRIHKIDKYIAIYPDDDCFFTDIDLWRVTYNFADDITIHSMHCAMQKLDYLSSIDNLRRIITQYGSYSIDELSEVLATFG